MFSTVDIRKFRSCRNVQLTNVQEILVLIGRNGAGKTNVLRAIEWACQFASGSADKNASSNRRQQLQEGDIALTFTVGGATYCYELRRETRYVLDQTGNPSVVAEIQERVFVRSANENKLAIQRNGESVQLFAANSGDIQRLEIAATISVLPAIQALFPEKSFHRVLASNIVQFLSAVKYYPLHNFDEPADEILISGSAYQKWKAEKGQVLNSISSLLFTLIHMSEEHKESFEELNSLLGPKGMNLIDSIEVIAHSFTTVSHENLTEGDKNTFYFVTFRFSTDGEANRFTINDLSFGTIRLLFLLVSLLYDRATVSLVEQPEDGVHIALVDKLIPLLRAYSVHSQFIVASHSTAVLNRAHASEIRLVSNRHGHTEARALSEVELRAAERYLEEDGPLSEFLESIGED